MKEDIRNGNMSVYQMKQEILSSIEQLQAGFVHKRAARQLNDAKKFLDMIAKSPYKTCRTVSELKKQISLERAKVKQELEKIDVFLPGHQFSMFEQAQVVSEGQRLEAEKRKENLNMKLNWLHKCLGMCSNRKYFS